MMGHSQGNIDLDRYGKGYNPDLIYNKCVKHLHFETSHARGIEQTKSRPRQGCWNIMGHDVLCRTSLRTPPQMRSRGAKFAISKKSAAED